MNNFRGRLSKVTLSLVLATSFAWANEGTAQDIGILINGQPQTFDVKPVIQDGRTLAPMRGVFETLGAALTWDEASKTVKAVKDDMEVAVTIGSYFGEKNGESVKLDVQPVIIDGRTMVPLRFISEALGAEVVWDDAARSVLITTKASGEAAVTESKENAGGQKTALTYGEAAATALKNSYDYKNAQEGLKKSEEQYSNVILTPGTYNPSLIQSKKSLDVYQQWAEKQVDITKESIEYNVENAMKEVSQLQSERALEEKKINNSLAQLKITELKAQNGLESDYNLTLAKQNYEQELKEKGILDTSINSAYIELNQLLGIPKTDRYDIEIDIAYSPMEEVDIDDVVRKALAENPHIWYQEKEIELAELGVTLYQYNAGTASYTEKEINVRTAKNDLADMKSKLEQSLRLRYDQIKKIEENYKVLEINLDKAQQALSLVRTQYDVGMAIDTQLREAELAVEEIQFNMKELAVQHVQLVKLLNKPYLAPDYIANAN
ncbi:MAG: stalk domain-containing protein [Bacillota bacterium]